MISIDFVGDRENYHIEFDDTEESLSKGIYCFVKACIAAGYYIESFDQIVRDAANEIGDRYNFRDYLEDCNG